MDNNFIRNIGIVTLIITILSGMYLILTFFLFSNKVRNTIWHCIKIPIPSIIFYFALQFDQNFEEKQVDGSSLYLESSKAIAIFALLGILCLFGWNIYGVYKYAV